MNIYEYAETVLPNHIDVDWKPLDNKNWPLDSHCGQKCRRIIDKGFELLSVLDETWSQKTVREAIKHEVMVICFG